MTLQFDATDSHCQNPDLAHAAANFFIKRGVPVIVTHIDAQDPTKPATEFQQELDKKRFQSLLSVMDMLSHDEVKHDAEAKVVIEYAINKVKAMAKTCEMPGCRNTYYLGGCARGLREDLGVEWKDCSGFQGENVSKILSNPHATMVALTCDVRTAIPVYARPGVLALEW